MTKRERRWWRRKRDQKEFNKIWNADDSDVSGWLCGCGHWQDDDCHCSYCGGEPPWGCPCDFCQSAGQEDELEEYDPLWGGHDEPEYDPNFDYEQWRDSMREGREDAINDNRLIPPGDDDLP